MGREADSPELHRKILDVCDAFAVADDSEQVVRALARINSVAFDRLQHLQGTLKGALRGVARELESHRVELRIHRDVTMGGRIKNQRAKRITNVSAEQLTLTINEERTA